MGIEQVAVIPDVIAPGEAGKFYSALTISADLTEECYYETLFLTAWGELFIASPSLPGEKVKYHHIGKEKAALSEIRFEAILPEVIEIFDSRVEPTNQDVRNIALLALTNPPKGIASDSEAWKIWQLNNWVASNIDYISDPTGKEYFAYAHETLEAKAGDCDDISTLLASLYEAVGLDAVIALVDTDDIAGSDHAACLVYWSDDADTFRAEMQSIIEGLGLIQSIGEFNTLHYPVISLFLSLQDAKYQSYEGTWIVADPIAAELKNMVGYITYRPYTITSVFNVGN